MHTWQPVTCKCKVAEIVFGPNNVPIGMAGVLNKCEFHAAIPDSQLYGQLLTNPDSDGKRFCGALRHSLNNFQGVLSELRKKENGDEVLDFKPGISWEWEFTGLAPDRILTIRITGIALPAQAKAALQNRLNLDYGLGKVVLEN